MNLNASFHDLWQAAEDFELSVLEPEPNWCKYARRFAGWCEQLCLVTEEPEAYAVNQAILLLTKKYFEWRTAVPRRHRDCLGSSSHVCIYEVFVTTYERLQVAELSLTPPLLFEPPPPPPPPQIAGLALGLKDESS